MSIQRDVIPFGPGKIVHGADTFYSAGDIDVVVITKYADVRPDQAGQGVKTILDQTIEVSFKPQSVWALLTKVYPTTHINPTIGSRLIGASPTALIIHGESSSLLTVHCPGLIQLPSISLGVDKGEFGEIKFVGVCTNAKNIGDSGALYSYAASGGTYGTPTVPDYLAVAQWDASWKSAALSGTLLEACVITPDFQVVPAMAGSRTLDFRVEGCQFAAALIAAHDMVALSTLNNDGTSFKYGGRNTDIGGDLVLTSALGHTFTLVSAAIEKSAMKYAMKEAMPRAIDFRTSPLSGARISWTTP